MENSHIAWTTHTFNPWHGCQKVSPGCQNCYMFAWKARMGQEGTDRRRTIDWMKPLKWDREFAAWRDQPCAPHLRPVVEAHARLIRARVFPSLCDWLDDKVPIEWLADFLKLIHDTPNLDWQLLSKRPENFESRIHQAFQFEPGLSEYIRLRGMISDWVRGNTPVNIWLGVSVENQKYADARLEAFKSIPAAKKFVSYEPALGAVNWKGWEFVHQIIFGGESGPGRRPCEVEWAADTMEWCQANKIAFFCKQDTHRLPGQRGRLPNSVWETKQFPE